MIKDQLSTLRFKRFTKSRILRNTIALYGVQGVRKVLPLLTIPYLARVLGPAGWGTAAFILGFANLAVLFIEFGFTMSATREIARHRDSRENCRQIVTGVISTQFLIFALISAISFLVCPFLPAFGGRPSWIFAALIFAAAQGLAPLWYLQGLERMQFASVLDISGKVLSLVCLMLFVHSSDDIVQVVLAQAVAPGVTTAIGLYVMVRDVSFAMPSRALLYSTWLSSWPMFLLRAGAVLYGSTNIFILGFFAPPVLVGYFAGAGRIITAAHGLLTPVADAIYPRLSHLSQVSREQANRLASLGSIILVSIGLVLSIFLFVAAPVIVRVLIGKEFEPTVQLLQIMSPIVLFAAIVMAVGTQWLLPAGRDREMTFATIGGGLFDVALACLLGPRFLHVGVAWTATITELVVAVCVLYFLRSLFSSGRFQSPLSVSN